MPTETILYTTLAAIFALGFVFFTYFFKTKKPRKQTYLLGVTRFLSIFTLLILLINPKIIQTEYEIEKPDLVFAIDQSSSIKNLQQVDSVLLFLQSLKKNEELKEHFNITEFSFGGKLNPIVNEDYQFEETQTNIHNAVLQLNKLYKSNATALVMLSDGNATFGQDYEYFKLNEKIKILPIVVGDTTASLDLSISALNVNKYAFLNNKFPVEVILNYSGDISVNGNFQLRAGKNVVFSKPVELNKNKTSEIITTNLTANKIGTSIYEASFTSSENEKNRFNNTRKFAVEVIDEKSRILIVSDIIHPDLGALKKSIEKNEQREVILENVDKLKLSEIADFQLVITYQPNNKFKSLFTELNRLKTNRFIITGSKTDWNFLNTLQAYFSKNALNQTQDLFPIYNSNYLQYQFEDLGFIKFPPLEDAFGTLKFDAENSNILLYQKVEGIATQQPLMSVFADNTVKTGVLFGENLWKWRAETFRETQNFEPFDDFIGKFIQYLSSNKKRDRLTYENETVYLENEEIKISAQYFDENYVFDAEGDLNIYIKDPLTGKQFEAQMLPNSNFYKVDLEGLSPGEYQFMIREEGSGIKKTGSFTVLEFNVEQQFSSANFRKLNLLAGNNEGKLYFLNEQQYLIDDLIQDKRFVSVQKSHEKTVPLINWKFLLILLALSLSVEWFTRKYFGLI